MKTFIIVSTLVASILGQYNTPTCAGDDKNIDWLYGEAQKEANRPGNTRPFTVYEGGDSTNGRKGTENAFLKKFPLIKKAMLPVNYSNAHDIEINNALKDTKTPLKFDAAHLQTVHDFYDWADGDHLLEYMPQHFDQVPAGLKDSKGRFFANEMVTFAPVVQTGMYQKGEYPLEYEDFVKPEWKGKLVLTYPNHDDAVLYQFHHIKKDYGEEFMKKLLVDQKPRWVKGTDTVVAMVSNKTASATFTGGKFLVSQCSEGSVMVLPKKSHFLSWGQTLGIFKRAQYPCTAKLYAAWTLTEEYQTKDWQMFPSRKDLKPSVGGFAHISEYNNTYTSADEFVKFMRDRKSVDAFRDEITKIIGAPAGPDPFNDPNL